MFSRVEVEEEEKEIENEVRLEDTLLKLLNIEEKS